MKIIDIGICVDNNDPKGLGRIRYIRYLDWIAQKEKSTQYEKWDDKDPFIALPFLPLTINFVPQIKQSVKIISYNTDNQNINTEYIAGPFANQFDFNSQSYETQVSQTTYGTGMKYSPDLTEKEKSMFPKYEDFGICGKYGSDIIFTENGLQLRSGKLAPKEKITNDKIGKPIQGKSVSALHLKKFPNKLKIEDRIELKTTTQVSNISLLLEYEIDSLDNPTKIYFYVYKFLLTNEWAARTDTFTSSTIIPSENVKLINADGDSSPTFIVDVTSEKQDNIGREIKNIILLIREKGLKVLNLLYDEVSPLPLYYKPSNNFINLTSINGSSETLSKKLVIRNQISTGGLKENGLIWSKDLINPPSKQTEQLTQVLKNENGYSEYNLASLRSDKIYLLSSDTVSVTNANSINFNNLSKYELTQKDYTELIEPNTYSMVRGETLLKIIKAIISVMYTHRHQLNKPMVKREEHSEYKELEELLKTIETDILNKSIRIN